MKPKHFFRLAVVGSLLLRPSLGLAQSTEERAGARAAADQGYDAFKSGRWADAVDLFGRAESLVHSPIHLIFLARSQAKMGRLLEAKEAYLSVLREPDTGAAQVRKLRRDAERELAEIEPQIPYVTVEIRGLSPSDVFEVSQDGRPLPPALIGVARPVNPGEHVWLARTGERQNVTETRTIAAGTRDNRVVLLLMPEVKPVAVAAPAAPIRSAEARDIPAPMESSSGPPALTYVGFGVAAVGVGFGVGFLLQKGSIEDEIERDCRTDTTTALLGCVGTEERLARRDDADQAGLISAIGFIGAGVALTGAVTLWLVDSSSDDEPSAAGIRPWLGLGSAGVSGRF
jgi:hypothetical protein